MARPRNDQSTPCAAQRIKDAFWTLLRDHDLKAITVSMVVQQAHCNRGTFYYHFDSLEALLDLVIEEELLSAGGVPHDLFLMIAGADRHVDHAQRTQRIARFGLMMEKAGRECVWPKVHSVILGIWQTVLCDGRDELTPATRLVIEYSSSGILGSIDYLHRAGMLTEDDLPENLMDLLQQNAQTITARIAQEQGIPLAELAARLHLFSQFLQMNAGNEGARLPLGELRRA